MGEALVCLVGGRMDGQWYHAKDWADCRSAAARMAKIHGHVLGRDVQSAALGYVDTGAWAEHPMPVQWPQGGTVWRWNVTADQ